MSSPKSLAAAFDVQRKNRVKGKAPRPVSRVSLEEDDRPSSIADAIMAKRKMAQGGEVINEIGKENYDDSELTDVAEPAEEQPKDRVSAIRQKLKQVRGF